MSALLRIADDRGRWAVIAADVSVGVPPDDACTSRVLVLVSLLQNESKATIAETKIDSRRFKVKWQVADENIRTTFCKPT